jgi:hypothetical protein
VSDHHVFLIVMGTIALGFAGIIVDAIRGCS